MLSRVRQRDGVFRDDVVWCERCFKDDVVWCERAREREMSRLLEVI